MKCFAFFHSLINWHVFYTYSTSQFKLAIFHVLNDHICLLTTLLDSAFIYHSVFIKNL